MPLRTFDIQRLILILAIPLAFFTSGSNSPRDGREKFNGSGQIEQFDLLTNTAGWVLIDKDLYWTSDLGQSWVEIGPSIPFDAKVEDVYFIDSNTGWILWNAFSVDGSADLTLAQTLDQGTNWEIHDLSLFTTGEVSAFIERAGMGWFDAHNGWIAVKQSSGSNFSQGILFRTSDGGKTWVRSTLPIADQVIFSEPLFGWAVGGPAGDQIFNTQDGGVTWKNIQLDHSMESSATVYQPFQDAGNSVWVVTTSRLEHEMDLDVLEHSSNGWITLAHLTLNAEPGTIGLSILDSSNLVATLPGTSSVFRMEGGILREIENKDGFSASIVELNMASLDVGWAKSVLSNCVSASHLDDGPVSVSCDTSTRLMGTLDGGVTWQDVRLPSRPSAYSLQNTYDTSSAMTMSAIPNVGRTESFVGQGFDKCEIPTISQMQKWWDHSPYKTVNLYMGGSSRACSNNALSSTYLISLYQQGWKFIPTWVGPQAPCTGFISRMSNDVSIAYSQGIDEANLAVERLAELGLTYPDKTGSVVYYDIEYYGTNITCRNAVNAFMNGWVSQLHARGNLAGVYGSTLCNTGLSDFLTIANVPDVIWPARWYHNLGEGYYDPNATVWDLGACVPNTTWADHQRVRQYEGDHNETWGNLTLGIDSNVLDGVVAAPYAPPSVKSITRAHVNPTNADVVDFTVSFYDVVYNVDVLDFSLTTTGITDASITDVDGSGATYTVTVNTGTGDGTIRLDMPDTATIVDVVGTPPDNLPFISGETYTVGKTEMIFQSFATDDGWIRETGENTTLGGKLNNTATTLKLGDDALNRQFRSILSFDTSSLPDNAVITSVTLKIKYAGVSGTNPFSTHGRLLADICDGGFSGNTVLEKGDFNIVCGKNKVMKFTGKKVDNWYSQVMNPLDYGYINLTGMTEFRLRFAKDDNNDFGADFLKIYSGDALLETDRPQLIVDYCMP